MAIIEETDGYRILYGPDDRNDDRVHRIFKRFADMFQRSCETYPDLKSATDAYFAGKVGWNEPEGQDKDA